MAVGDSILGRVVAAGEFRSREFMGPRRMRSPARTADDQRWWPTAQGDSESRVRVWLLKVRDEANEMVRSRASLATARADGVTVSSSRSSAVSAKAMGGGTRSRPTSFQVKVTNLAVSQVNEGQELATSDTNAMQAGTNTFTIKVGTGAATTVSFINDSTDTYAEALENLATTINDAATGVTASVVKDEGEETVRLVLTADATGFGNAFTVADVNGNVVGTVGVGSSTIAAENAELFVNGVPRTSGSNTVLIDQGRVQLRLEAPTGPTGDDDETGAVISVKPDSLAEAVLNLAGSLNGLLRLLETYGSADASRTRNTFERLLVGAQSGLEGIGISIADNGQLSVDRDRLETAIASSRSTLSALLGGVNGFGERLSTAASAALQGSRIRVQHSALFGADTLPPGSQLLTPDRDSSRGVLVDVLG